MSKGQHRHLSTSCTLLIQLCCMQPLLSGASCSHYWVVLHQFCRDSTHHCLWCTSTGAFISTGVCPCECTSTARRDVCSASVLWRNNPRPSATVHIHDCYTSLLHNLIVLSFSSAAEAMMLSVGWHAQHRTTSGTVNYTCSCMHTPQGIVLVAACIHLRASYL